MSAVLNFSREDASRGGAAHFPFPLSEAKVAVIGLGYVGLPLATAFANKYPTVGFDVKRHRVEQLRNGVDETGEVEAADLRRADQLCFSNAPPDIANCNVYIVAVPTPVDRNAYPDLTYLHSASRLVGEVIGKGDVVIYESTVYPGATEEDCVPVIEQVSGLRFNEDFFVGYSPERVNPGDKARPITSIVKVTSGSTPEVAQFVDELYASVIQAGTFKASSIRVAEAAKIIENTQRDVNIALVNELSIIFSKMGIDTGDVLAAARTKWNFIDIRPGLVGGHCIGVDPYYLLHKSIEEGYMPDIIRTSRQINDSMARHVASRLVRGLTERRRAGRQARVLIVGFAFKEDCPDVRNSKVGALVDELRYRNVEVDVFDDLVDQQVVRQEYGLELLPILPEREEYDGVILAVPHHHFVSMGCARFRSLTVSGGLFFDLKSAFPKNESDLRL